METHAGVATARLGLARVIADECPGGAIAELTTAYLALDELGARRCAWSPDGRAAALLRELLAVTAYSAVVDLASVDQWWCVALSVLTIVATGDWRNASKKARTDARDPSTPRVPARWALVREA